MRKLTFLALLSASVGGCTDNSPSAYQHGRDQFFAVVPGTIFDDDLYPCFRSINNESTRLADEDCYRFDAPTRMRGVWANGFEEGSFYPKLANPPATMGSDYWLEVKQGASSPEMRHLLAIKKDKTSFVYLDFIGRRTTVEGRYGHLGSAKHLIIVDRIITAKPLN